MKKSLALLMLVTMAACVQHSFRSDDDDDDDDGSIWERPDGNGDGDGNSGAGGSGNTTSSTKATSTKATSGSIASTTGASSSFTSAQSSPASTTSGPVGCDSEATCNDCQACAFAADCSAEYNACANNPGCFALNDCLNLCAVNDQACVDQCVNDNPNGVDDLLGLINCIYCDACYVTCDGASSC